MASVRLFEHVCTGRATCVACRGIASQGNTGYPSLVANAVTQEAQFLNDVASNENATMFTQETLALINGRADQPEKRSKKACGKSSFDLFK